MEIFKQQQQQQIYIITSTFPFVSVTCLVNEVEPHTFFGEVGYVGLKVVGKSAVCLYTVIVSEGVKDGLL